MRFEGTKDPDFLMGRPQVVRVGNNTSATLILNMVAPQGWVISPLLYSLFTQDCVAKHDSNTIIKFADDTTVVGLITTMRQHIGRSSENWCQDNNLSLNVSKIKEPIMDYKKRGVPNMPPLTSTGL